MNVIEGNIDTREVFLDGKLINPKKSRRVYNHSPDGFMWGYGGSGPAQLALAVLLEVSDVKTALAFYQDFKWEVISKIPMETFRQEIDIKQWIKIMAKKDGNDVAVKIRKNGKMMTVSDFLNDMKPQIKNALPTHLKPERFFRIALTLWNNPANDKLRACEPMSFIAALMTGLQLGLEPNTPLGQAYLIPYGGYVQFQLGYRGMLALAYRTNEYEAIYAESVYPDDDFSYDRYTDENRRFHTLVAQASGNFELVEMIGHLHDRLARFMVYRHAGESQEVTHGRIIKALAARDLHAARQSLLEDIDTSRDAILDFILSDEADSWEI